MHFTTVMHAGLSYCLNSSIDFFQDQLQVDFFQDHLSVDFFQDH